jgi:hypothetical protein
MTTYKITLLGMALDNSENPPAIVKALFPNSQAISVELSTSECVVTFATPQTPANLGPLVIVELLPSE